MMIMIMMLLLLQLLLLLLLLLKMMRIEKQIIILVTAWRHDNDSGSGDDDGGNEMKMMLPLYAMAVPAVQGVHRWAAGRCCVVPGGHSLQYFVSKSGMRRKKIYFVFLFLFWCKK